MLEQKQEGPTVVRHTTAPGQEHSRSRAEFSTAEVPKKWVRILTALVADEHLNRHSAEQRHHDHALPSTISEIQRKGVRVQRREERIPGYRGRPAYMARYWLDFDDHENLARARALLAAEAEGTP